jgi:aconitate hydratase
MVRGTLANIRLRNLLAPGTEGGGRDHLPDGEPMFIYDAAMRTRKACRWSSSGRQGIRLRRRATGRPRAWRLLGVRAVIAESFERIHRSNLVGMGVLPLQFQAGDTAASLGLTGKETFHIEGVKASLNGGRRKAVVRAVADDGVEKQFTVVVRVDTPQEVEYYRNGGILPYVLRQLAE